MFPSRFPKVKWPKPRLRTLPVVLQPSPIEYHPFGALSRLHHSQPNSDYTALRPPGPASGDDERKTNRSNVPRPDSRNPTDVKTEMANTI